MNKLIGTVLTTAMSLALFTFVNAQGKSSNYLITSNSVGAVRLGMTISQARKALQGVKLERTSDAEGIALVSVKQGGKILMTFYTGEENPENEINEKAEIKQIEVWDKSYKTTNGVYAGMSVTSVERKYGKLKRIIRSEMEEREYAAFARHPKGIEFRLLNKNKSAGVYGERQQTTTKYTNGTFLFSILVTGRNESFVPREEANLQPKFSSVYSDLKADCKSAGGDDAPERQHFLIFCKGVVNYQISVFDTAGSLEFVAETVAREDSVQLASQALDYDMENRKVEWRMADGVPFAVILPTNTYKTKDGLIAYPTKITGDFLVVKGLKGYENIDFKVKSTTPGAHRKARALTDSGYAKSRAASQSN